MKKLKLLPILRHMDACEPALDWVELHKFSTFKEVWAAVPAKENWHYWVACQLRVAGFEEAQDIDVRAWQIFLKTRGSTTEKAQARREYYLTNKVREVIEGVLIQYAYVNDCAEEEEC